MDPADLAAKANAAANTVLDILKKEWFLNLLLWLLLLTELNAIWTGRSMQTVLRAVVVHDLGWTLFGPVIDGVERTLRVVAGYEVAVLVAGGMLVLLVLAVLVAFWRDGRRLPHTVIVELAPLNLMLRFTVLTTLAAVLGNVAALVMVLVVACLVYAFGAASGAYSRHRVEGFGLGVMTLALLGFLTLLSPFVLVTLTLWRACSEPIR